ncbi:MAG: hypothetical protein JO030_05330 [Candidatus Eremiobacteraeota bacterium]|nr:hypothetical protein [Candidatus Eremiobacteraeota bacterium]
MNAFAISRYAAAIAAVTVLGACTGTRALPPGVGAGQTMGASSSRLRASNGLNQQRARGRSWMSRDAKHKTLLYVGDEQTDDVYVYSYPEGKLKGTLTGIATTPFGECSDRDGNVWITDLNSQIVEYAHGGTTIIATLNDPGQASYGCAVDPESGDLAVANLETLSGGPGSVSIYKHAKGTPKVYADPNSVNEYFLYYHNDTLYVVGQKFNSGAYQLAAFAHKKFTDLTLTGGTISYPGGVGFDHGLWIGDSGSGSSATIYQIAVKGTTATVTGTTPLTNGRYCGQELAYRGAALCPSGSVLLYKYPAGGDPYKSIGNLVAAYGVAISK